MVSGLPDGYDATRETLHRVAVHVLARRRAAAISRFGLRPAIAGFATPTFGQPDEETVLRVAGTTLVREHRDATGMHTSTCSIDGATLDELAAFAGADLSQPFSVGRDTPGLGDVTGPLRADADAAELVGNTYAMGARAIDTLLVRVGERAAPTVAQLWPEHFDLGIDIAAGPDRVNLGTSPGDKYHAGPYAYVGPWSPERPGDAEFWNAPFGALLDIADIARGTGEVADIVEFFARGVAAVAG